MWNTQVENDTEIAKLLSEVTEQNTFMVVVCLFHMNNYVLSAICIELIKYYYDT